ncbi:hypothetical protein [Geobacter sp. SVR]|uniref:hypothetical protein n=1 Tax=Geobacter sp. SVR TaxID=2495594 RepID=UPI00143F0437|nr:hypothetical protein [Geobacter sp. SVR]BCS54006.1 hypothetical protein GSVR_23140 [Geobacter sp. SVR]GCF86213.1 hypothetical protein GSbR_28130 [Geobacter sp. SVR]
MTPETVIRTMKLSDGVTAAILDATCHYFGGYYHVRLRVEAEVPLSASWFDSTSDYRDALERLGASVRFERSLEKMAVPENEIEDVRQALLQSFEVNVQPYLSRPDFARRFVLSEHAKAGKSRPTAFFRNGVHV